MTETKIISVLGATGSVGTQALDVAETNGYAVNAISCNKNIDLAEKTVRKFGVKLVGVEDPEAAALLRAAIKDTDCAVISGKNAAARVAEETEAETVVNAVTGIAGLSPTLKILGNGKKLALANKESLVTAGETVTALAKKKNTEILPVDSEHSAIWQALRAGKRGEVKKLLLTASGGPFFGYSKEKLASVTAAEALKHPTWKMGKKITADSATLMNKGFEVMEAKWLFGVEAENIEVVVHRESIIHSMVEYKDNIVIAQLGAPDMRSCIQYALTYPERTEAKAEELDFSRLSKLTFASPDRDTFPLLGLAERVCKKGGSFGAALNGANEEAVALFLEDRITLPALFSLVEEATEKAGDGDASLTAVFSADEAARRYVKEKASNYFRR